MGMFIKVFLVFGGAIVIIMGLAGIYWFIADVVLNRRIKNIKKKSDEEILEFLRMLCYIHENLDFTMSRENGKLSVMLVNKDNKDNTIKLNRTHLSAIMTLFDYKDLSWDRLKKLDEINKKVINETSNNETTASNETSNETRVLKINSEYIDRDQGPVIKYK